MQIQDKFQPNGSQASETLATRLRFELMLQDILFNAWYQCIQPSQPSQALTAVPPVAVLHVRHLTDQAALRKKPAVEREGPA